MRVLVVEDDEVLRSLIVNILLIDGCVSNDCADAETALEKFRNEHYDLVISDIIMQGMNGIKFLRLIKKMKLKVPVILITAYSDFYLAVEALNLGAVGYLLKPFKNYQLLEKVGQIRKMSEDQRGEEMTRKYIESESLELVIDSISLMEDDGLLLQANYLAKMFVSEIEKDHIERMKYVLAVNEALRNGIEHGNLEIPSELKKCDERILVAGRFYALINERLEDPEYANRKIHISIKRTPKHVTMSIRDEGKGFNPSEALRKEKEGELDLECYGRGLLLIDEYMDEVTFNDKGNEITLRRNFKHD